jgi:TPR repeat protein
MSHYFLFGQPPLGQFNLGMVYLRGMGAPQDMVRAHMRFSLVVALSKETASGTQGKRLAENERSAAESGMTAGQIEEAKALAQEWLAKHTR